MAASALAGALATSPPRLLRDESHLASENWRCNGHRGIFSIAAAGAMWSRLSAGESGMLVTHYHNVKRQYKKQSTQVHACTMAFPNTCAIRMSEALVAAKLEVLAILKASGKNVCPHGYIRGAQDIRVSWLVRPSWDHAPWVLSALAQCHPS
jgi:hypothetical protein